MVDNMALLHSVCQTVKLQPQSLNSQPLTAAELRGINVLLIIGVTLLSFMVA